MKNIVKRIVKWKYWKFFNEFLPFPFSMLLWWFFVPLGRRLDPSLDGLPLAYFEKVLFGTVVFCWFIFMAWMVIRLVFPKIWSNKDLIFKRVFEGGYVRINKDEWRKIGLVVFLFSFLLVIQYFILSLIIH